VEAHRMSFAERVYVEEREDLGRFVELEGWDVA
jgi:hypothetical protein